MELPERARHMQASACRNADPPLSIPLPHSRVLSGKGAAAKYM